jgi:hypothetical protein
VPSPGPQCRRPPRAHDTAVIVYLVGYILSIIDCHICRDIFRRIDIMYSRLPYVSRGALPLKTTQSILSTWHQIRFRSSKSFAAFVRTAPGEIDLDSTRPLVRRSILLIQPLLRQVKSSAARSSPSDHHQHWPPTQLHSYRRRRPRRRHVMLGRLFRIGRPPLRQIHAAI